MTEKTKIALSAKELELVCNKEWILTKHIIIEKVYALFGALALSMQQSVAQHEAILPIEAIDSNPKISKGENYKGLPYVMLDYPRHFSKESTLAIRTMFWWGNFFSINLHLSGSCKEMAMPVLEQNFAALQQRSYWLCIHTDPWQHHFEEDNYVPMEFYSAEDFSALIQGAPFIKIAKKISLQDWDLAEEFLMRSSGEMMMLLQVSYPGDGKDPLPGIPTTDFGL